MPLSANSKKILSETLEPYFGKELTPKYVWAIGQRTKIPSRAYEIVGKLVYNCESDKPLDPQKLLCEPLGKEWESCLYDR